MPMILRIVTLLLGVGFTLQGFAWLVDPATSAAGLGMPLLDGVARSTQVGDFSAFFLVGGLTILVGNLPGRGGALYFPAALIGTAAITRTLAWAWHGADFATLFVVVETVTALVLISAARASADRL